MIEFTEFLIETKLARQVLSTAAYLRTSMTLEFTLNSSPRMLPSSASFKTEQPFKTFWLKPFSRAENKT